MTGKEIEDIKLDICVLESAIHSSIEEIRKKSEDITNLQGRIRELFYILKKRQEWLDA